MNQKIHMASSDPYIMKEFLRRATISGDSTWMQHGYITSVGQNVIFKLNKIVLPIEAIYGKNLSDHDAATRLG